jgi:hypothetical protein
LIRVYGRITPENEERLGGMEATVIDTEGLAPETLLSGRLPDQAALAGVLMCICDSGMPLLSVQRQEI